MLYENIEVLGKYKDKCIVQNEWGQMFFFIAYDIDFLTGSIIESEGLRPICELSHSEETEIKNLYG